MQEISGEFLTLSPDNWESIQLEYPIPKDINHIIYSIDFFITK